MRSALVAVGALLGGCGDPGDSEPPRFVDAAPIDAEVDAAELCGATGMASTSGTLMGATIDPVLRATGFVSAMYTIVLDEIGGPTCGAFPSTGEQLVLLFCRKPTPGIYPVGSSTCPGDNPMVLLMRDGAVVAQAASGTVTILTSGSACMGGSFSARYMEEEITGTFDAVACP